MSELLTKLLVLQDRDQQLARTQQELQQIPAEEKAVQKKLHDQSKNLEELKLRTQKMESERKDLENQVTSKQEAISRYKTQQFQTKKNEEFQALGHEIEHAEKDIVVLDDRQLELMEELEGLKEEVKKEQVHVTEFEKTASTRMKDLKTKVGVLEGKEKSLQSEVTELSKGIDGGTLERYRRLLKSKGDAALVPVKDGTQCGGCHMKLTHQTVISAKTGELATCENCGRYVYWQAE